ncbi:glycosyltransferase 87 family protein [Taibaiella lutea]|nr:glycosyltransferase 87 family protein [Taibaiella lutea]
MNKTQRNCIIFFLIILGCFGIYKTFFVQKVHVFTDMRNRVVGARLMKDGILPYHYHWHPGDNLKYVVQRTIDTNRFRHVSIISASPFFHRILSPVANYNEPDIVKCFFFFNYALLFFMAIIAWYESRNPLLVLLFFVPFLFTDGWLHHIQLSQYYLLFGFLLFMAAYTLLKGKMYAAALFLALAILFKPSCIIFLIPFFLYFKTYRKFLLGSGMLLSVYALIVCFLPFEKSNWVEYFGSIKEHAAIHQMKVVYPPGNFDMDAVLPAVFEGENIQEQKRLGIEDEWVNPVVTNFMHVYKKFTGGKFPPTALLEFLTLSSLALLIFFIYKMNRKKATAPLPVQPLILAGFVFYFIANFFAPINSPPYQMVQWMAVAAIFIMEYKKIPNVFLLLLLMGIFINLRYIPDFPGKHAACEMICMVAAIGAIFRGRWALNAESEKIVTGKIK